MCKWGIMRTRSRPVIQAFAGAVAVLQAFTSAAGAPAPPWPSLLGPREALAPEVSGAVERVWGEPTFTRTVNARPARVPVEVYTAFIDTPEVTFAAARFRHIGNFVVRALDEDRYVASDGDGARGVAHLIRREPRRRVFLSQGEHTSPFLGTITGSALTVLDLESRQNEVAPRLTAYVLIDDRFAAAMARMLIPTFGFIADRKLAEGLQVTAEVAEWAVARSGDFCAWLSREQFSPGQRDRILTALPSCAG